MTRAPARSRALLARLARAFTVVELLVAITILLIIMVVLFQLTATLGSAWVSSKGKISAFENARLAFGTLNATLGRATLNTYVDYVNVAGTVRTYRTPATAATFVPTQFARASELHFISGPAVDVLVPLYDSKDSYKPATTPPAPTSATNPGHAIFFQAPLGVTSAPNFNGMNRTLNSVGFYVQYGQPPAGVYPSWLSNTAPANDYRFRLMQYVEPSENLSVYYSTSLTNYDSGWINFGAIVNPTGPVATAGIIKPRARVLAEDVLLLVMRPRLSEADEVAASTTMGATYAPSTGLGSALCPNYHYDSRAWMPNYSSGRVTAAGASPKRALLMCNQTPPIVDVAMICADPQSLVRFGRSSATPPATIPAATDLFTDSSQMDADLTAYAAKLGAAKVHFHIMRTSVQIESSRWSNK